jgi:hypothetical protein
VSAEILAYHEDEWIERVWTISGVAGLAVVAVVGVVAVRALPDGPGGGMILPTLAILVAALAVIGPFVGAPFAVLLAPIAAFFGVAAVARLRRAGRKPFALAGFVCSLLAVDVLVGALVACGVTDACFH